ncbi:MAG: hypothetical protein GY853_16540 [PVC group bacterium]|nr:hypothetical protein [PVC group bacterium]
MNKLNKILKDRTCPCEIGDYIDAFFLDGYGNDGICGYCDWIKDDKTSCSGCDNVNSVCETMNEGNYSCWFSTDEYLKNKLKKGG